MVLAGHLRLMVMGSAVILSACHGSGYSPPTSSPPPSDAFIVQWSGADRSVPPTATINYGVGIDKSLRAQTCSGWKGRSTQLEIYAVGGPVMTGAPISVTGDASEVRVSYEPLGQNGPSTIIQLTNGMGTLPSTPGSYEFYISGVWPYGRATVFFSTYLTGPG
jgi:hypothetical protein